MKTTHTPGPWYVTVQTEPDIMQIESDSAIQTVACDIRNTDNARLISAAPELLAALQQALRYIEVQHAYRGAMTADQVDAAILAEKSVESVSIGANSCNTLATFNFRNARSAIAKATA